MIDSHCHLDHPAFDRDRDEVVDRARGAGVAGIFVPGVSPERWSRTCALQRRYPEVRIALGIHPLWLPELSPAALRRGLARLEPSLRDAGAAAVGECGLDGVAARRGGAPLALQAEVLRAHLRVAARLDLPVVLHCRRAYGALLELLEEHGPCRGVIHGYTGSVELIPRFAALGLYFGFGGIITDPRARRPAAAARAAPADRVLIETDAPDHPPHPRDRERSEPALLPRIAARLEALRGAAVPDNSALLGFDIRPPRRAEP